MIQMLPAPAAIEPSLLAMVDRIAGVTAPVARSTRAIVLSPQLGTHRLPNATASPEHGSAPTASVAATVLAFGSSRATEFFGRFETHTDSSTAIQSADPA